MFVAEPTSELWVTAAPLLSSTDWAEAKLQHHKLLQSPAGCSHHLTGTQNDPSCTAGTISDPTEHGQPSAKASAAPQKPHFFTPELPMGWGTVALRHWEGRGEGPSRLGACLPACHPITATELTSLLLIGSRQLINTVVA